MKYVKTIVTVEALKVSSNKGKFEKGLRDRLKHLLRLKR